MHHSYEISHSDLEEKGVLKGGNVDITFMQWKDNYFENMMIFGHNLDIWDYDFCAETSIALDILLKLNDKDIDTKKRYIRMRIHKLMNIEKRAFWT